VVAVVFVVVDAVVGDDELVGVDPPHAAALNATVERRKNTAEARRQRCRAATTPRV